jgi:basic amino acid/polyamine antiporter, APA family
MPRTNPVKLRRVLNAALGAAIVVGGSIGIGILSVPGLVAGRLGDPLLILACWFVGGVLALLGANIYAELGTTFPQAGGPYVYVRRAAGPFAGFVTGWADSAVSILGMAATAALIGEYLENGMIGRHEIAVGLLVVLGLVNWFGLKVGARAQQALTLFKLAGLVLLAMACFLVGGRASHHAGAVGPITIVSFIGALVLITETYAGWNSAAYFSEEDKDTDRNIPRALFWGIGAMMAAYLLFNAGLLAVMNVASLSASNLPATDASRLVFGDASVALVNVFAVVSLLGILNVGVMFTPRILFAMSREGVLPSRLSTLNRHATPASALICCLLPAVVLAAGQSFDFLFTVTAFLGLTINCSIYVSFFILRRLEPLRERPFRARWYPWAPLVVLLLSVGLLISYLVTDPRPGLWGMAAIALSWPVYRFLRVERQVAVPVPAADLPN